MKKGISCLISYIYKKLQEGYVAQKHYSYVNSENINLGVGVKTFITTSIEAATLNSIQIGDNSFIRGRLVTFPGGGIIKVGKECYIGENTEIWSEKSIEIGDRVLIAHNCMLFDSSTHPLDYLERYDQYKRIITTGFPVKEYKTLNKKKIVIKDDAWIGCNSIINKGCTIGKRSIVAAGAVVLKDVPDDVIVAGNPAKIIKYLKITDD